MNVSHGATVILPNIQAELLNFLENLKQKL